LHTWKTTRSDLLAAAAAVISASAFFATAEPLAAQSVPSMNCGSGGPGISGSGDYVERTLRMSSGEERLYLVRLPQHYQDGVRSDVVFNFHGATSNARDQVAYTGFERLADRDNVILIAPDANKTFPDRDHELATYWDSAWEGTKRVRNHDIQFVLELVTLLKSEYCTGDFFAAGMSAGGDMTTALHCETDEPFLAYAPVTYRYYDEEDCGDAAPRPVISFHGTEDRVVPLEGLDAPWFDPHVGIIMQSWAEQNGCEPEPLEQRISEHVVHTSWEGCEAATEWYLIEGDGHTWPGRPGDSGLGHATEEISATELIWEFFFERSR
jgi:polyhydroxybutyrate depolymerase